MEGITEGKLWQCGLEFDYANEESIYCRPLRLSENKDPNRMSIPPAAAKVQIAFLHPMSGLAANETRLDPGAINVHIGEGRTAEVLRQRQIYQLITDIAYEQGSQIIAASHSEVILNEAADRDMVIAFVGEPHRIDDRGGQVLKALKEIGFEHYYQAEQTGWVLYLEGSTDLAILTALANKLDHPAASYLERPFVHYVGNRPRQVEHHFYGLREALREAKSDLVGLTIFDRLDRD
jgi:hypothetical protein